MPRLSTRFAIHFHAGSSEPARKFADQNLLAFDPARYDTIINNIAGCGSMLKDYGHHWHDAEQQHRAEWASKVRDVNEFLDQLGLADRLLQLPHGRMTALTFHTPQGPVQIADLARLKTRFPFIAMMPQARFLEFLAEEAKRHPHFRLILGANVQRLVEEKGAIRGVGYRDADYARDEVRGRGDFVAWR